MSAINDLILQIQDPVLRDRIQKEVDKLSKQKKFGLVFEEHLPECTPLYDIPIKRGCKVSLRNNKDDKNIYSVLKIEGKKVICAQRDNMTEIKEFQSTELVAVAEFGESIYPYLKPIDSICNSNEHDVWHTLIESDNYHALQLLEYLYTGRVDCIYIDPPYNTGAKDWKYNNDYVDSSDSYRHSKWLSMIQRRLRLAKKLLNPLDSVLIITIDEKEYLHLGCLLEEMFPEANIQMISSVISRKGAARTNEFTRVNEFVYFVMIGDYSIEACDDAEYALEGEPIHWQSFRRSSASNIRTSRPSQFYPIYVDNTTHKIVKVGDAIPHHIDRFSVEQLENCDAVFPVRDDGTEMLWGVTPDVCRSRVAEGYVRAGKRTPDKPQLYVMQYLMSGTIDDIKQGKIAVTGYAEDGSIIAKNLQTRKIMPRTQWNFDTHDARDFGTKILKDIFKEIRFDFPKSLYAVADSLRIFLSNKKEALVLDFFAGSGTTLHAVNLLNAEDKGNRRCILVTNNEVSEEEAEKLSMKGYRPGDEKWNEMGIARYVTWPRTICSITGKDINGNPLKGNYVNNNMPMSMGFEANANLFHLGFLDKTKISLGLHYKEIIPLLWMKSGSVGPCPNIQDEYIPDMLIFSQNQFAVLFNENAFFTFEKKVNQLDEIKTVYIATDYEVNYRSMIRNLNATTTYQLYRDYLDHFRINNGRS